MCVCVYVRVCVKGRGGLPFIEGGWGLYAWHARTFGSPAVCPWPLTSQRRRVQWHDPTLAAAVRSNHHATGPPGQHITHLDNISPTWTTHHPPGQHITHLDNTSPTWTTYHPPGQHIINSWPTWTTHHPPGQHITHLDNTSSTHGPPGQHITHLDKTSPTWTTHHPLMAHLDKTSSTPPTWPTWTTHSSLIPHGTPEQHIVHSSHMAHLNNT